MFDDATVIGLMLSKLSNELSLVIVVQHVPVLLVSSSSTFCTVSPIDTFAHFPLLADEDVLEERVAMPATSRAAFETTRYLVGVTLDFSAHFSAVSIVVPLVVGELALVLCFSVSRSSGFLTGISGHTSELFLLVVNLDFNVKFLGGRSRWLGEEGGDFHCRHPCKLVV